MLEKITEVIVETLACDAADINLETRLQEDLGADSLDAAELNMAFEDALGTCIPDDQLGQIKTVGDIVAILEKK